MSIGNIASSIFGPSAQLPVNAGPSVVVTGSASSAPVSKPAAGSSGSTQLSADIQAKLLQLQATGSDLAAGNAAKAQHRHGHGGKAGVTSDGLVPAQAPSGSLTTAGAAPPVSAEAAGASDASVLSAMQAAMRAYAASGSGSPSGT